MKKTKKKLSIQVLFDSISIKFYSIQIPCVFLKIYSNKNVL